MPRLPIPTRISRLYPVFALGFSLSTAVLFYAWQSTLIELHGLSDNYNKRQSTLEQQVESLSKNQKEDQAKITIQNQQINDASVKLASLEKDEAAKAQDLQTTQQQLKDAQNQLSSNASELEKLRDHPPLFSFQNKSTTISAADVQTKEDAVKNVVSNAYQYIQDVYGQPYLLNQVTITFVDSLSISGSAGEIVIQNSANGINIDIHLKDFNPDDFQDNNTIIHEMIHGFHGLAVFDSSALEEGITVATTDVVMSKMIADGKLPHFSHLYLTTSESDYQALNKSLRIYSDNSTFYADPQVSEVYQVIGTAWYKLYTEKPDVFKLINQAYYPNVQRGQKPDQAMVLSAIRSSISQVGGQSIDTFLATNAAFNPS